jgi:D-glycero-beta-D-manno-heptose 1-phosphate adenylyltransferase
MKASQQIPNKIFTIDALLKQVNAWRLVGKKIVFTNGVFDIVHQGHIASLTEAASYGDILIIGLNADVSVKRLKGPTRPINDESARAIVLASFLQTDAIIIFEEDTPLELIKAVMPDVLVKGGDYTIEQIAGAKEILENGGVVKIAAIIEGVSSTNIIEKMKF